MVSRLKTVAVKLVAGLFVLAVVPSGSPVFAKDLIYGSWVPPRHALNRALLPVFKSIKKESGGSLNWILKPGGQLFSGRAALVSVGKGLADATGPVVPQFTRSNLKNVMTIAELFAFGDNALAAVAAATDTILNDCPQCIEDFHRNNTVYLAGDGTTEWDLLCHNVVRKLDDMRNLKVRTSGASGRVVEAMGAIPVSMTAQDMIEAISRGQIDCVCGPMSWLISYPIMDSIKSIIDYPLGINTAASSFVMNRDTWNDLTAREKRIMLENVPRVTAVKMVTFVKEQALGRERAIKRGVVVTKGGADFKAMMEKHRAKEKSLAMASAHEIGAKDPEGVAAAFFRNLAKWEKVVSGMPVTADAYEHALKEQIYSRVDISKL